MRFSSKEMNDSESALINQIENDAFYRSYLNSDSKIPQTLSISEQVKKLSDCIELISSELQKQVLEKHDDLLKQGNHASKLETVLGTMKGHVQNLCANAERLRNEIVGPYQTLETQTRVLGRLHLASHIFRQVSRIQQLSKRLASTGDSIQKATILHELEQLAEDSELKEVDAVTLELRNIRGEQQKLVKLATITLNQGLLHENISQTTTALQIFINLNIIEATLETTKENAVSECRESIKAAFEIGSLNSAVRTSKTPGRVTLTTSQNFRNKIWIELERAFSEDIYQQCKQIKFLQTSLNNLDRSQHSNVAQAFWKKLGEMLQNEVKNATSAVEQMLDDDYPKLLRCFREMHEKLKCNAFVFDRQVFEKCENAYLSSSLTRLLDPAQAMFSETSSEVPNHDQIDSLIRSITNELSMSLIEVQLSEKVCKNASKCIKMFALKTEQQFQTGPEASQVIGNATMEQLKNIQYANALYYLQVQVMRMLTNMKDGLSENGFEIISTSLETCTNLTSSIIQPIVTAINATIETIIITIHVEPDWNKLQVTGKVTVSCSPYMRELTQFITRAFKSYLADFENKEVLTSKCGDIAVRCIELFVRHCSLLRPISQGGRVRLHSDFSHLENALKVIYPQLSDLGRPYRLFKSMQSLIVLTPEQIAASQVSESSVPHSTVLLLLFSYAAPELASPHQNTGWSLPKISTWLDEHPEESDRLDLITGALQRYENVVRQKNSVNYDPVYPIMANLLEDVIKK